MASGTFQRPLPNPADEKSLLGLDNAYVVTERQVPGGGTRYINFPASTASEYYRQGFIIIGGGAAEKTGLYIFNGTNNQNFHVKTVLSPTSGYGDVTKDTNSRLKVTNPKSTVQNITVISTIGNKPTITSS